VLASFGYVIGSDLRIIPSQQFGCSCRVGRCAEDVLHLMRIGQRMQVGGGGGAHGCSGSVPRGRGARVSSGPLRRPRGVAQ